MSDGSNVVKLFPDKPEPPELRNKMERHQHSSLELMIISVAKLQSKQPDDIKAELCAALGVQNWEDANYRQAQDWLKQELLS